MAYKIHKHTLQAAKELGVVVKPSRRKGKKIDIFSKAGKYLGSVGAQGYNDYTIYLELEKKGKLPKGTAAQKRNNFHKRHKCKQADLDTNRFYACYLLW